MPHPQSTHSSPARHTPWTCAICARPVEVSAGILGIPFASIAAHRELNWRPLHGACVTPEREVYGVPLADLETAAGLARWSAHLMEKSWFADSNWRGILLTIMRSEVPV